MEFGSPEATAAHIITELIFADRTVVAYDSLGRRLGVSRRYPDVPLFADAAASGPFDDPHDEVLAEGRARVLRVRLDEGIQLVIAMNTAALYAHLADLRLTLALGLPMILLVGGALGSLAARRALRPIVAVAAAADRIGQDVQAGATEFRRLPPHPARDEIATLTSAFNTLVERLSDALARERAALERQRAFLADAAHELRTPVAILRSEAEVALSGPGDAAAQRRALERVAEEARGMGDLVGDLLFLARGDEAGAVPARERLYLDDVANHVIARAKRLPIAAQREIRRGAFEAAPAHADPQLIERAVLALVHNALVHAAPAPIEVSTGREDGPAGAAWVRVRDEGPGIPPEHRARVFERFTRFDTRSAGTGLGLAIARWAAEAHGGTLTLENGERRGASFLLRLPATPDA